MCDEVKQPESTPTEDTNELQKENYLTNKRIIITVKAENKNHRYSNKLFWCFGIIIGIVLGLFVLCSLCLDDFQWNLLIVTAGAVLLGICTMICVTVMCIKHSARKVHNDCSCDIDREIIKAALNVKPSIQCQCKCNTDKECKCRMKRN